MSNTRSAHSSGTTVGYNTYTYLSPYIYFFIVYWVIASMSKFRPFDILYVCDRTVIRRGLPEQVTSLVVYYFGPCCHLI